MTTTELFIANILLIWGLHFAAFNLFHRITGKVLMRTANTALEWISKPLWTCRPCMSSVWGLGFWLTSYEWYYYPIWVVCLGGASTILTNLK